MRGSARSLLLVATLPTLVVAYLQLSGSSQTPNRGYAEAGEDGSVIPVTDLGEVRKGAVATLVASVKNDGAEPLVIEHVETDCGCTALFEDPAGQRIPPGESLELKAAYHADVVTDFRRHVRVDLADVQGQSVDSRVYAFTGRVVEQVRATPTSLHDDRAGQRYEVEVSLRWGDFLQIEDVAMRPEGPYEVSVSEPIDGRVNVVLLADQPSAYAGTLYVRAAAARIQTVRVPVRFGLPAGPTLAKLASTTEHSGDSSETKPNARITTPTEGEQR